MLIFLNLFFSLNFSDYYLIFNGLINNSKELDEIVSEKCLNLKKCSLLSYKIFNKEQTNNQDKKLLNKYRMSFDVDWFQIQADLYQTLIKLLSTNSTYFIQLNKIANTCSTVLNELFKVTNTQYNDLSFMESFSLSF